MMKVQTHQEVECNACQPRGASDCWLPLLGVFVGLVLVPCWDVTSAPAAEPGSSPKRKVDYNREVRPILAKNCFACHGQDEAKRKAGLRLDHREAATQPLKSGETAIVPGDVEGSALLFRATEDDDSVRMPPAKTGNRLNPADVDVLQRWIEQGAEYAQHWSLIPPEALPLPAARDTAWPRNGIDFWILDRLEKAGLAPSPQADAYTLLRRASLDLRGLPPKPEEVDRFIRDQAPGAYERAVDRFLDDPAYGERWARMWLDLARYADSAGFGSDPLRPNIWRYRDWVIEAFNRNLPYDRFTLLQIAGDLMPGPSLDDRIATAFHRNTMTNTEGGTDDEEFRVAAIKDRVDTTAQVWMGLTMGCAKCHSHKYDPITHEEYYRFYAFFNQSADNDQPDEGPVIPAPTAKFTAELEQFERRVAALRAKLEASSPALTVRANPVGGEPQTGRRVRTERPPERSPGHPRHHDGEADPGPVQGDGRLFPLDRARAQAGAGSARRDGENPSQAADRSRHGRAAGRSPARDARPPQGELPRPGRDG